MSIVLSRLVNKAENPVSFRELTTTSHSATVDTNASSAPSMDNIAVLLTANKSCYELFLNPGRDDLDLKLIAMFV